MKKGLNRSEVTLFRQGVKFVIPIDLIDRFTGLIEKETAYLIRNATKDNINKLESMGVRISFDESPKFRMKRSIA